MASDVLYTMTANAEQLIATYERVLGLQRQMFQEADELSGRSVDAQGRKVRQLGFAFQRFGVQGVAAFGEIYAAIGPVGLAIGALTLGVVTLTKFIVGLAKDGAAALESTLRKATELAIQLDTTSAQLTGFFEGDLTASEATLQRILDLSLQLGENVEGVARAFLPEVESLDQLEQVVKLATALARSQPEQGQQGARIALQDLLSGQTRSLVQRFEIPLERARAIKEALATDGIQAGLDALEAELNRTGRSVDDLSDTFIVWRGRVEQAFEALQRLAGEPILESLKEEAENLLNLLTSIGAQEDLGGLFVLLGEATATGIEAAGDAVEFIINYVRDNADAFGNIILSIQELLSLSQVVIEIFTSNGEGGGDIIFDRWASSIEGLADALLLILRDVTRLLAIGDAAIVQARQVAAFLSGNPVEIARALTLDPVATYRARMDEYNGLLDDHRQRVDDTIQSYDDFIASLDDVGNEGEDAANKFLAMRAALERAAEAARLAAEAQATINEEIAKMNLELDRAVEDIGISQSRRLADDAIDAQQDLEDATRDHLQKLADIRGDYADDVEDDTLRAARKREDILRDFARREIDIAEDLAEDRAEVERDLQAELDRINRRYDFNSRQAIRNNDAVSFVRNEERRQFDLNEARIGAQGDTDEVVRKARDRRRELQKLLEQELEDARIANDRRIQDTLRGLQRQLDAESEAYARDLQELQLNEQRKQEERQRAFEEEIEDFNRNWDRKLEDLSSKYEAELRLLSEYQQREIQLVVDHQRRMITLQARGGTSRGAAPRESDLFNSTIDSLRQQAIRAATDAGRSDLIRTIVSSSRSGLLQILASLGVTPRKFGGPLLAGRSYLFEGAPEILSFPQNGFATPLSSMMARPVLPGGASNSYEYNINQNMMDPSQTTAQQRAIARQEALRVFKEIANAT